MDVASDRKMRIFFHAERNPHRPLPRVVFRTPSSALKRRADGDRAGVPIIVRLTGVESPRVVEYCLVPLPRRRTNYSYRRRDQKSDLALGSGQIQVDWRQETTRKMRDLEF